MNVGEAILKFYYWLNGSSRENTLNNVKALSVDTALHKFSKSTRLTTNTSTVFITPSAGNQIVVQSVYISTEAVGGEARIEFTNGEEILPLFIDNRNKVAAGDFNQVGAIDDTVTLVVEGTNGTSDTFFGVSYLEIEG